MGFGRIDKAYQKVFERAAVFIVTLFTSIGIMYLVSILCALYPAWKASRLSPTDALYYE